MNNIIESNLPIRISYGEDPLQFGDLRIPKGEGSFPVILLIHGGCWRSAYDLTLMDPLAEALTNQGFVTWNLEYRRTEDPGGGWPGTFHDVAFGLKKINTLKDSYTMDTSTIIVMGHSAGGHLALWLGAQFQLSPLSEIQVGGLPRISGIVSLAGIINLTTYFAPNGCGGNVINLMGGTPESYPDRYREGTPTSFLPLGTPQVLVHGAKDEIVPLDHVISYYDKAKSAKEDIQLIVVPDCSHRDVITPESVAWSSVLQAIDPF